METRSLGRSGLQVSALGFGAMTFSEGKGFFQSIGTTHGDAAARQVDLCLEAGVNFFDTADVYDDGRSEQILGRAIGERRREIVLATKAFSRMEKHANGLGLGRRHLIEACEASLRRLGTDWIDLYQLHNFDAVVPLEETLRALDDLVRAGKVRYIGCSNFFGWQLMKATAISDAAGLERMISQQIQYSLMTRDAEEEILPCGVDQGVGAIIWGALASGFLSGKFRDGKPDQPTRLAGREARLGDLTERGGPVLDVIDRIVAAHPGASPTQVAINWLLKRPGVACVLFGARNEEQLLDNLGAAKWSLSDFEEAELDKASQQPFELYPGSHQRVYMPQRNPQLFARY